MSIAYTREDILKIYPDAKWMPWDDPPIGQHVFDIENPGQLGIIVGRAVSRWHPAHGCPSCEHWVQESPLLHRFWTMKLDVPLLVRLESMDLVYVYPPRLMHVGPA